MTAISVVCNDDRRRKVEAIIFKQWAAHPHLVVDYSPHQTAWTVTLVPSGRCISETLARAHGTGGSGYLTSVVAQAVAKKLSEVIPHIDDWQNIPDDIKTLIKNTAIDTVEEIW